MNRYTPVVVTLAAFAAGLAALTYTDADVRRWWFRAVAVLVGLLAVRAIANWHAAHPRAPEPFRRRRRTWRRRRPVAVRRGTERAIELAIVGAGDAHRGLRPLLQEIADERLRSLGLDLQHRGAEARLAPETWELVRPDRPVPHDIRAPGLSRETIDAIFADLEDL